jgi:glucosamine--fructose-6-phosphate aminotransferase (isomerizing)
MSTLHNEIYQQPDVIKTLLEKETAHLKQVAAQLKDRFQYIIIAARGTSDNAARYAQYLFGAHNRLYVGLATPSLFTLFKQPPVLSEALVMGISQSGQSPDIVSVVVKARQQGRPTIAITNHPDSPLAQNADYVIALHAGQEQAVAATKTYTASVTALALFSTLLAGDETRLTQLDSLPELMTRTLENLGPLRQQVESYPHITRCAVIGRGYNYATAFEIALKVKELTGITAEPYSAADFYHGPIAMVRKGFPIILVAPQDVTFADMQALSTRLKQLQAHLILISDNADLLKMARLGVLLPTGIPAWLTPVIAVLPGQNFALTLAESKALNPDRPIGLTKVTETY